MVQRIFRRKIYDKILKWKEENQGKTANTNHSPTFSVTSLL